MKIKLATVSLVLLLMFITSVSADSWSALDSGYAVTTNYQGENVPLGTLVTATAGTTDQEVTHVIFRWMYPNGTDAYVSPEVAVWQNGTTHEDKLVWYATNQYTINVLGDWGVQSLFYAPGGLLRGESGITAIRATSFNAVPEIAIIGTAGAAIAMLLGFGFFYRNKKSQ